MTCHSCQCHIFNNESQLTSNTDTQKNNNNNIKTTVRRISIWIALGLYKSLQWRIYFNNSEYEIAMIVANNFILYLAIQNTCVIALTKRQPSSAIHFHVHCIYSQVIVPWESDLLRPLRGIIHDLAEFTYKFINS